MDGRVSEAAGPASKSFLDSFRERANNTVSDADYNCDTLFHGLWYWREHEGLHPLTFVLSPVGRGGLFSPPLPQKGEKVRMRGLPH